MESSKVKILASGILAASVIFIIATILPKFIDLLKPSFITHLSMLILSLAAIAILGKSDFKAYGFQKPEKIKWLLPIIIALGLGAIATLVTVLLGISGIQAVKNLSLPEIILYVWIIASICEEVLIRGFLQSYLAPFKDTYINLWILKVNFPTFIAALFFSLMHLIIIKSGADLLTVVVILIFTFCVGILAGYYRSKSGSIVTAIILHMLANVGGVVGGIIYGILTFIITGHPPKM